MRNSGPDRGLHKPLTYRPDIDGLRAVAVLIVIGFHAFPSLVPGGFIGVDVFFVISGFLITSLITRDIDNGSFSLAAFYGRRIRRIFPALLLVLIACLGAAWFFLAPNDYRSLGKNAAGGAAFIANFVDYREAGYFGPDAARTPLLHLWSLGIEEQFYIVWPFLLLAAGKIRRLKLYWLVIALGVASFVLCVLWSHTRPTLAFYSPLSRAWELMAGGFLATLSTRHDGRIGSMPDWFPRPNICAILAAALILVGTAVLSRANTYPGMRTLLPVIGTLLLIAAEESWLNRHIFASPLFVSIGLISYPLYLWHWPILAFGRILDPSLSPETAVMIVAASFLCAWLTYRLLEKPIRTGTSPFRTASLCAGMAAAGILGLFVLTNDGFAIRLPADIRAMASLQPPYAEWRRHKCLLDSDDTATAFSDECAGAGTRPLVFLWGDSYAGSLYPGLKAGQSRFKFDLAQYTAAGCPPVLGFPVATRPYCIPANAFVLSKIAAAKPDIVIVEGAWDFYPNLTPELIDATLIKLKRLGVKRIVVIGDLPFWPEGLPHIAYELYQQNGRLAGAIPARTHYKLLENIGVLDQQLSRNVAALGGVEFISAWNILCNSEGCLTRVGDKPEDLTTFDSVHLTLAGSDYLGSAVVAKLFSAHVTDTAPK